MICPRCTNDYGNEHPATSRTDNTTAICPPCGTSEAMEDFLTGHPTPRHEWPTI